MTDKLSDARRLALEYIADGKVTRTEAVHPVKKAYYTVSGYWQKPSPAPYDFLIREGYARATGPMMRAKDVTITDKGKEALDND